MSKLIRLSIIATASLFFLLLTPAFAGVYKWIDTEGQVHYGAQPGNTDAEKMTIRTNETTKPRNIKTEEDEEKSVDGDSSEQNPAEEYVEVFKEPEIPAKEKRRLCTQAKDDITNINNRGRMREINAKGEYIYLSEKQRQQRISAAKERVNKYCR